MNALSNTNYSCVLQSLIARIKATVSGTENIFPLRYVLNQPFLFSSAGMTTVEKTWKRFSEHNRKSFYY